MTAGVVGESGFWRENVGARGGQLSWERGRGSGVGAVVNPQTVAHSSGLECALGRRHLPGVGCIVLRGITGNRAAAAGVLDVG